MGLDEFHAYWREKHGGLYTTLPFIKKYVRHYNQCHTVQEVYDNNEAVWDGTAELWFDDYAAVNAFLEDPEYLDKVRPDEKKFCDFEKMQFFVTTDEKII